MIYLIYKNKSVRAAITCELAEERELSQLDPPVSPRKR